MKPNCLSAFLFSLPAALQKILTKKDGVSLKSIETTKKFGMFVPLWIVIIRMLIINAIFNFERISFAVSRGPKVFLGVHYFSVQSGTSSSSSSFSAMTHRVPRTHTITQTLDPLARLVLVRKRRAGGKMIWQLLRRAITEARELLCTCDPGAFEVGLLCTQHVTVVKW